MVLHLEEVCHALKRVKDPGSVVSGEEYSRLANPPGYCTGGRPESKPGISLNVKHSS